MSRVTRPQPTTADLLDGGTGGVLNVWQRGVPEWRVPILTGAFMLLLAFALVGTVLGLARLGSGALGSFTALTDPFPWGVWKTFNVMALTALGSAGLAVGFSAWVLGRRSLHTVMRTALAISVVFYATGLLGIATDVGRPWNFWNALLPWRWNTDSAMWEISLAMPLYTFVFLLFECSPAVVERFWYTGSPRVRAHIQRWRPRIRAVYPFVIAGAYVLPMVHQASLGSLLLLAGDKVHPLWQSPILPLLYVMQAGICGFGSAILFLMGSCLVYRRPLDTKILGELGSLLSWLALGWLAVRFGDLAWRGELGRAFRLGPACALFHLENLFLLVPAIALRSEHLRETPRTLFRLAVLATLGGILYRFDPTTIAFDAGPGVHYFPSAVEVFVTLGLIALAIAAFSLAVKLFAILPATLVSWKRMLDHLEHAAPRTRSAHHGHPNHD